MTSTTTTSIAASADVTKSTPLRWVPLVFVSVVSLSEAISANYYEQRSVVCPLKGMKSSPSSR